MPDIDKTFGSVSSSVSGFQRRGIDPDNELETLFRALKHYVNDNSNSVYDIRFGYPEASEIAEFAQIERTIIHFEIDDQESPVFGFGDNVVDEYYDEDAGEMVQAEAVPLVVNFDVGIWASRKSGGVTARLRAMQLLHRLFKGAQAQLRANEYDFDIIDFRGGSFIRETVGSDIPVFRAIGIELIVRVFGRRLSDPVPVVEEIVQSPELEISDEVIVDVP